MKEKLTPLNEKISAFLVFALFIGIVLYGTNAKPITSDETAITEEIIPFLQEENNLEYFFK